MRFRRSALTWVMALVVAAGPVGCAAPGYRFGRFRPPQAEPAALVPDRGGPDGLLDGLAGVVDAPAKLVPFGPGPARRELSPATETLLADYLRENDMADVHVAVNRYDPAGEWRRLRANTRIGAGWRYTVGALGVVRYTLLPERVFGVNRYHPYTDTLSINSDRPAAVLYEAAVAKDIRGRAATGGYATATSLPGIGVVRGVRATGDVLSYARAREDWPTERAAYRELYPRVAMSGASAVAPAGLLVGWWAAPAVRLGGAAVGHGAGWLAASRREAEVTTAELRTGD